jgi:NADPH:quinone reductase-like Zn-dependent oxidoreductase
MLSAWQIRPSSPYDWTTTTGITNLYLTTSLPKPIPGPKETLVRIRAAALNARDMMVVAHDPIYLIQIIPDLTPCADGAGVVEAVGEGSKWKVGERVLLNATGWVDGDVPTLVGSKGMGAGDVMGALREYAVMVLYLARVCLFEYSFILFLSSLRCVFWDRVSDMLMCHVC